PVSGTLTGTINAGSSSVTISGVIYDKAESGVVLTATRASGDSLTAGDSAPFTVNTPAMTDLPMRSDFTTAIFGGTTSRTLSTVPDSTPASEPFNLGSSGSASVSFDFYSPPLTATGPALMSNDKARVTAYLQSASGSFSVTVGATFYDYNPSNGAQIVIVTAGDSNCNVGTGATKCQSQNTNLGADYTVPAGHQLKVTVTITRNSGTVVGTFIYNGSDFSSSGNESVATLPFNRFVSWPFGSFRGRSVTFSVNTAGGGTPTSSSNTVTASYTKNGSPATASIWDGHSATDFADIGSTVTYGATSSSSNASERWAASPVPSFTVTSNSSTFSATYYDQFKLSVNGQSVGGSSATHDTPGAAGTAFGSASSGNCAGAPCNFSAFYDRGSTANATLANTSVTESGTSYRFLNWTGNASGTGATSSNITMTAAMTATAVWDAIPSATVSLNDHSQKTNDTLTATATKSDLDGGAVTLTFVWKVNGVLRKTTSNSSSLTDTFDLSQAGNGSKSDTITVEVTPNDGLFDRSTASESATIVNSAPTVAL